MGICPRCWVAVGFKFSMEGSPVSEVDMFDEFDSPALGVYGDAFEINLAREVGTIQLGSAVRAVLILRFGRIFDGSDWVTDTQSAEAAQGPGETLLN